MSDETYNPDLAQSVEKLRGLDEYRVVLEFIRTERERFVGDLRQAESPNDVMKIAGSLATLQELLETLS
jgi:hypothetical protein